MATNRAVTNGMFDSFAGPASELPPSKRTPPHVLAALRINPGDRVAQASLVPSPRVTFHVVEQLSITERGAGGFGSTGAA